MSEAIIETIRRLIALGSSPNEHESQLAMAKASDLMAKHNLAMADVQKEIDASTARWITEEAYSSSVCHFELACVSAIVSEHFFVKVVSDRTQGRQTKFLMFGEPTNVKIARYVMLYLIETFRDLAKRNRIPRDGRKSYFTGLYRGLDGVLKAERETLYAQNATNKNALVCVKNQIAVAFRGEFPRTSQKTTRTGSTNNDAYAKGREDGAAIKIRQGIDGGGVAGNLAAHRRLIGSH